MRPNKQAIKERKSKRQGTRNRNLSETKEFKTEEKRESGETGRHPKLPEETRSRETETTQCRKTGTVQEHPDTDGATESEAAEVGQGTEPQETPPGTSWLRSPSVRLTHSP